MARCLVCLLLLAAHSAAGSLDTGFAVRFNLVEGHESVHVRDRGADTDTCDLHPSQSETVQLHEHDILVVSIAKDSRRSCLVDITAFPEPFNLDNDTNFARLALEGWAVNVTTGNTPFNISLACYDSNINMTVKVMTLNAPGNDMQQCCAGTDPQHDWCHRCGKGQYREGLLCHPCPGRKTTLKTGVFTKDNCICPEGYANTTDECPKCTKGTHSVIQGYQNMGCQPCGTAQPETGPRATACPGSIPDATNPTAQPYQATQYLRPRQEKCDKECCVPGEYWDTGLERCQNCVDGYNYSDTRGATTCQPCQPPQEDGWELLGCFDTQGSRQKCKKGFYRDRDDPSPFCTPCPPRKTTASEGKSDETSCLCEEGYIDDGANGCTACGVGKYNPGLGEDVCTECPQHKTTRSEGSTTIEDCVCDYGFYGEKGAALCSRCERRQYQDELGRLECEECEICPYGGYATGCGGANKGECRECTDANCERAADGEQCDFCGFCNFNKTYSVDILNRTRWFNSTKDKCDVCGGNITEAKGYEECHYCPAGTSGLDGPWVCGEDGAENKTRAAYEDIVDASQCRDCAPCAVGSFKNTTGLESKKCEACPVGKYADVTGLTACYDCDANKTTASTGSIGVEYCHCEAGFYHNHTNGTDDHQCFRCEPGTFSEALNHHVCNDCDAGKYNHHMVVDVSDTCLSCERDTWSGPGAAECIECVHSITYHENSTSILDCKCKPGYMNSSNGEGICIPCDPGTYGEGYPSDRCEPCLEGKYSNVTAATSNATCSSCDVGTFALAGASACELCPAGKYADARDTGECMRCLAGKYSTTLAARSNTTCRDCPGDSSSLTGSDALSDCVCNQGYTGPDGGLCGECGQGKFKDVTGSVPCENCPVNSDSPAGSDAQTDCICNIGHTGPDGGACQTCQSGTYKTGTGSASCQNCPDNSVSPAGSDAQTDCACNRGYTGPDGGSCHACEQGQYKNVIGSDGCLNCLPNSGSPAGSDAQTDCLCNTGYTGPNGANCIACLAGTFKSVTGSSICRSCPANSYSPTGSAARADCACNSGHTGPNGGPCTACAQGKYKAATGAAACQNCPGNSVSPAGSDAQADCVCNGGYSGPNGGTCTMCVGGKYKAATGSGSCQDCPAGSDSTAGSDAQADCVCNRGYSGPNGGTCTMCVTGKYKAATGSASCQNCPAGSTSPTGSDAEGDCVCNAGYAGNDGGTCTQCGAGQYEDTATNTCSYCPSHSTSPAGSDNVNDCQCKPGYTGPDGGVCSACPAGQFKGSTGNGGCTLCPCNSISTSSGSASCSSCTTNSFASYTNGRGQTQCQYCADSEQMIDNTCGNYCYYPDI